MPFLAKLVKYIYRTIAMPYTTSMTTRYALYDTGQLRDRFAPAAQTPRGVKPHYNISPATRVPVIVSRDGATKIEQMIWGFVPVGAKDTNSIFRYKTFAARSEKILDTHTYRTALRTQRCLIPANGFYEWKQTATGKRPFYIRPTAPGLFGLAGIYSTWIDPDGTSHGICAIITIDSDTESDLIPSRLPVIVEQSDEASWLDPSVSDLSTLFQVIRPYDPSQLEIVPVGDAVNSTKPDTPELIVRLQR